MSSQPDVRSVEQCNPGSPYAIAHGCCCPRLDNAHGRGYLGGATDKKGKLLFVINGACVIHGNTEIPNPDFCDMG